MCSHLNRRTPLFHGHIPKEIIVGANIRKHWNDPVCIQRVLFILVITLIGTFIYAAGLNIFLVPHHFLAGGVTGIAMILYYLMDIPIGLSIWY